MDSGARGGSWWKLLIGVLLGYVLTRSVVSSVVSRRQKDALSHHVLTEVSSTTGGGGVNAPTRGGGKGSGGSAAPAPAGRAAVHVRDVGLLFPGSIVGADMTAGTGTAIMTLAQHLPACDMRPEALPEAHGRGVGPRRGAPGDPAAPVPAVHAGWPRGCARRVL